MSNLSDRDREHVAIGAAVGAGCRPCTQYHVKAAIRAGLTNEDIGGDIEEAELGRIDAAMSTAAYARRLAGSEAEHQSSLCSPTTRSRALAQVGAATGANAGYLLSTILPQARGLGVSDDALAEAAVVASKVKEMAAHFFAKDAERALASGEAVAVTAEAGSCTPAEEAVDEPVPAGAVSPPAKGGCC